MMSKLFKGANVFMSRNLVPPEVFDSLHDALKNNGADIFLCCDPARNGPDDYHVISSCDHEKFSDLQSKGCRLLGPQCVLSCAKECRPLPRHSFACCLAMDGVKVLASGFDSNEKTEIGKMVASMGGTLYSKASLDVNFVIVKNVLAAKYKWALNVLKKPIITISWLHQCWKEHRVVPQEAFKVPPFYGLTICVSRIPADVRKEMEKLVLENGGKYSAELTKSCTHLICDVPEGDKYKVAKRWGCIHMVTRKWFDQSVARKASMDEESFPVQYVSTVSASGARTSSLLQRNPVNCTGNFPSAASSMAEDSNFEAISSAGTAEPDLEATFSQKVVYPTTLGASSQEKNGGTCTMGCKSDMNLDGCIADDSQSENDLYLSECQISLVGFSVSEMRKLVNMIRRGGGSRYMSLNERLTHIVVGTPTDIEIKEIRSLAAMGILYVVRNLWLGECDREKKEVPVLQRHIAHDVLIPKERAHVSTGYMTGPTSMEQGKSFNTLPIQPHVQSQSVLASSEISLETKATKVNMNGEKFSKWSTRTNNQSQIPENGHQQERSSSQIQDKKSNVFAGMRFCFGSSFPLDRRGEINDWVHEGGGLTLCDKTEQDVNFIIQCHGMVHYQTNTSRGINVSSHWIKSCLEDERLLDVGAHILYSPLPCQIPLPGFEGLRICISQYDQKERLLLRNLCFVLGAKYVERLTRKVTHLLCKFIGGPKYEAACKWKIKLVTCEWIYQCVKQNEVVGLDSYHPKEVTSQDQVAELIPMSQFTQSSSMMPSTATQYPVQFQVPKNKDVQSIGRNKKARLTEGGGRERKSGPPNEVMHSSYRKTSIVEEASDVIPNGEADVASAIEDLIVETSKIQDLKSPRRNEQDKDLFSSDCTIEEKADLESSFVFSKNWMNRDGRKDETCNPSVDGSVGKYNYDGFSETQTESQVVGYEEDLSGRQMIIDRVRTTRGLS
ncbi:DNA topoisomerase 2-binding protein 1 [Impatiens glandulifera]|uniref:DNA topoisomerase 2-binding protein 1 n=1 Tax=Impatiens glandulifera TaxID=253017 RepID=UPI001FB0FBD1|nr:DNA topoisomerase 2-binding protein 1 [Impatiens glandulifera]